MNDLTKAPIPGLIRKIAIPASVGFFFNTMYNVVDTYYAGFVSTDALAALSISFPVFFLIIAIGSGLATGATALIGNALGRRGRSAAMVYTAQAVSFTFLVSIFLTVAGLISAPYLFRLLGASGIYLELALQYINIILLATPLFLMTFLLNACLNAQGDTKSFRNFLIVGFFLNIVLDPWFMFGGIGLPAMGFAGIAWATVLIQVFGVIYIGYKAMRSGLLCRRCIKHLLPTRRYLELAGQGLPASVNMMTVAAGIFVITYFISGFGREAVAAFGIATRIEQIALLPTIGLNIAALALSAQNNGAGKLDRVREAFSSSIRYGAYVMAIGTLGLLLFAEQLMALFTDDIQVVATGTGYLRIAAFVLFAYVLLYVSVSTLQGMKRPMYAIYIGVARQLAAPLAVFYVTTQVLGLGIYAIWWGIFAITWAAALFTLFYVLRVLKVKA